MLLFLCLQVDDLKSKLASQEVELAQKNEAANKLIQVVGAETEKVSKEKAIADEEEKKVQIITEEVSKKQQDCEEDLAKAEPALKAAQEALNTLNKVPTEKHEIWPQKPRPNPHRMRDATRAQIGTFFL